MVHHVFVLKIKGLNVSVVHSWLGTVYKLEMFAYRSGKSVRFAVSIRPSVVKLYLK